MRLWPTAKKPQKGRKNAELSGALPPLEDSVAMNSQMLSFRTTGRHPSLRPFFAFLRMNLLQESQNEVALARAAGGSGLGYFNLEQEAEPRMDVHGRRS